MKSWILFRTQRRPTCLLLHVGGSSHRPLSVVGPRHTRPPPHVTPGPRHTPHSAAATRHTRPPPHSAHATRRSRPPPHSAPATLGPATRHTRPKPHAILGSRHTGPTPHWAPPHWAHVTLGPVSAALRRLLQVWLVAQVIYYLIMKYPPSHSAPC